MKKERYASLVFPIPVDKEFHYKIPSSLAGEVALGQRVKVRFGNRKTNGYIVRFVDNTDVPKSKLNPLLEIIDPEPLISANMLKLTRWMAHYYYSSWGEALDMVLPGGVKRYSTGRTEKLVTLNLDEDQNIDEIIEEIERRSPKGARVLRTLKFAEEPILIQSLINNLKISRSPVTTLVKKGLLEEVERYVSMDPYEDMEVEAPKEVEFTEEQRTACHKILEMIEEREFGTALLHGITGSGKTEIYLTAISRVLARGENAIVLIPEISLTPQTVKRFRSRFGEEVAVLHSGLTDSQRYHQWNLIREKERRVVIGPRSAIFAPVEPLGLIVVDEEHETSFKESSSPRYNGRDVAVMRAHMEKAVVILGSATPSLISYHNAKREKYELLTLTHRPTPHPLPQVEVVDMKKEYEEQKGMVTLSRRLIHLMEETLEENHQIILFLNRRGFSTFIVCQRCGYILKCDHCDITLTFHKRSNRAVCHYCGHDRSPPDDCPDCYAPRLRYLGSGTEKIEKHLGRFFPDHTIARLDSDTMTQKGGYLKILEAFRTREVDILVGTQIIAKGLDFPGVTLVGVISADVGLHLPDFYAAERTFQLLTQVAGRAGRGDKPGRVVIQTLVPDHYSIVSASNQDYHSFVDQELKVRKMFGYPPFKRVVRIVFRGEDMREVVETGKKVKAAFPRKVQKKILGPAPCPITQIRGEYRYQIFGKFATSKEAHRALEHLPAKVFRSQVKISVDVDPLGML